MKLGGMNIQRLRQLMADVFSASTPSEEREGQDEATISLMKPADEAEVSSLSVALFQMGLMKHMPEPTSNIPE